MTPAVTVSNLKSLNQSADPIYYNMNSSSPLLTTSHSAMGINHHQQPPPLPQHLPHNYNNSTGPYQSVPVPGGHYNPMYQHSTPNLANNQEYVDELYNNRPPSVRSSYSNFHGARSIHALNNLTGSSMDPGGSTVAGSSAVAQQPPGNVFTKLVAGASSQPQAIPQLPQRTRGSTDLINDRSMAFLNGAPPAYNLNYHTPPDSETTM